MHLTPDHLLTVTLVCNSAEATSALAEALAPLLGAGDTVLLRGPVGAGKTHFARALIQMLLGRYGKSEDVPSPSFTLVQTYNAGDLEIWHVDLYRVSDVDEVIELGLDDALPNALCLIEWPERLGTLTPDDALQIAFSAGDSSDTRRLCLRGPARRWSELFAMIRARADVCAPTEAAPDANGS